jgi:acyl carrier protein
MSVRLTIASLVEEIAAEQQVRVAPLTDDLVLLDSGLDSLCFAILVARLEDKLGIDPFTAAEDAYFPETFGDFVKAYERVAVG